VARRFAGVEIPGMVRGVSCRVRLPKMSEGPESIGVVILPSEVKVLSVIN
jgi:hypothetical protein